MASMSPTASLSARHKKVERSCILCHQRKIRCDKRSPCSNCVRVDVLCCYPSQQQNERRPHRTTITEVAARVARLERTITAISKSAPLAALSQDGDDALPISSRGEVNQEDIQLEVTASIKELLIEGDGTSRYFNEGFLSGILAEEEELRSALGSLKADDSQISERDLKINEPTQWQALQLWQAFVSNVDPVVKILHIPTAQVDIYKAINKANNDITDDLRALLFSIYFAATTSLSSSAAASLLGQSKDNALLNYKQGLEHWLSRSDFLDSPTMNSLQALTLYIACLRVYDCGRASWALNGLVQRTAQSIGLHRDGRNFGLPPFQSEMRRRLWGCMQTNDARTAEDLGISLPISDPSSDTALPLNVNDAELSPGMDAMPVASAKWTDMTLCLIQIEMAYVSQQAVRSTGSSLVTLPNHESRSRLLQDQIHHLQDKYMGHCDENNPVQRAVILTTSLLIAKLEFLLQHQQSLNRLDKQQNMSHTDEEALVSACIILEKCLQLLSDELLRGLRWHLSTYFQYHIVTYVLRHLCIRPNSPNSAIAFKVVEDSFRTFNYRTKPGSKWTVMLKLMAKAVRLRKAAEASEMSDIGDCATSQDFGGELPDFGDIELGSISQFDPDSYADFTEWDSMIDSFDMDSI